MNVRITVSDFWSDPMFPRIERAVASILVNGKTVAPVDVLVRMGMLAPADLEAWRQGKVPYLERMIHGSLSRLSRLLRILGFHCHDLKLVATPARYTVHGRKPAVSLRFTKTGEARLEKIYARHFVWPGKIPFHPPRPRASGTPEQARGARTGRQGTGEVSPPWQRTMLQRHQC
jgi:hypothetical protein